MLWGIRRLVHQSTEYNKTRPNIASGRGKFGLVFSTIR